MNTQPFGQTIWQNWIHSETRKGHDKNMQLEILVAKPFNQKVSRNNI